jgi:Tfp pilus assembly protein PilP
MKRYLVSLVFLTLVVWVAAPVLAQENPEAPPPVEEAIDEEVVDTSQIDEILRGEQDVMQGDVFNYDPAGRRDPFRSLLAGFEEDEGDLKARPPGLAGMLIEELTVEGIIQTETGILAFVQGRDKFSYIIRPGTKLFNGEVKEISQNRVVFKQQVNDPKQIKPYEEVVRVIAD